MAKQKIAIIGLGKITQDQHLPVIDKGNDFEVAAVVSQRGLSHNGVPSFKTAADLYAAMPEIGIVSVNTPPDVRHAIAREALEAGKHVLLEKPPAATLAEFEDLKAFAAAKGKVLFATWHSQFNPAVDEAKALLAKHGVGSVKIEWREDVKKWHPGQEWIWEPGGFGVFDPGINALSIFVKILPFAPFVKAATLTYPENRQTPIAAKLTFGSAEAPQPTLTADFDWREQGDEKWHMTIETAAGHKLRLYKGGAALEVDGKLAVEAPSEEYERIYAHFAQLLASGQSDVDGSPLRLVADAMLVGRRDVTEAFVW